MLVMYGINLLMAVFIYFHANKLKRQGLRITPIVWSIFVFLLSVIGLLFYIMSILWKKEKLKTTKLAMLIAIIAISYGIFWSISNEPESVALGNRPVSLFRLEAGHFIAILVLIVAILGITKLHEEIAKRKLLDKTLIKKVPRGITIFGWVVIFKGLVLYIVYLIWFIYSINSQQNKIGVWYSSDNIIAIVLPLLGVFFFITIGIRLMFLRRSAIRDSLLMILIGLLLVSEPRPDRIQIERFFGLFIVIFYTILLCYLFLPKVKTQFE